MKYEIFWKVFGGEKNEKYTGSDIIETKFPIDENDADTLAGYSVESHDAQPHFKNLSDAVNNKCITVCEDWKITKIKRCVLLGENDG